jgi:hypothetical protein
MLNNGKIWMFFWLIEVDEKVNLLWLLEDEIKKEFVVHRGVVYVECRCLALRDVFQGKWQDKSDNQ